MRVQRARPRDFGEKKKHEKKNAASRAGTANLGKGRARLTAKTNMFFVQCLMSVACRRWEARCEKKRVFETVRNSKRPQNRNEVREQPKSLTEKQ